MCAGRQGGQRVAVVMMPGDDDAVGGCATEREPLFRWNLVTAPRCPSGCGFGTGSGRAPRTRTCSSRKSPAAGTAPVSMFFLRWNLGL
jgi:hypothetical protein